MVGIGQQERGLKRPMVICQYGLALQVLSSKSFTAALQTWQVCCANAKDQDVNSCAWSLRNQQQEPS